MKYLITITVLLGSVLLVWGLAPKKDGQDPSIEHRTDASNSSYETVGSSIVPSTSPTTVTSSYGTTNSYRPITFLVGAVVTVVSFVGIMLIYKRAKNASAIGNSVCVGKKDKASIAYEIFLQDLEKQQQMTPENWTWQTIKLPKLNGAISTATQAKNLSYKDEELYFKLYKCDGVQIQTQEYKPEYNEALIPDKYNQFYAAYMSRSLRKGKGTWQYYKQGRWRGITDQEGIQVLHTMKKENNAVRYTIKKDESWHGTNGTYYAVACDYMIEFQSGTTSSIDKANVITNFSRFAIRRKT